MWSIERNQFTESISKLTGELENANNDKAEMQMIIEELQREAKAINLTAYEESKNLELSKLRSYYKEKLRKKEAEYKKTIDDYDIADSVHEHQIAHFKVQVLDLGGKNSNLKHELKKTTEELEHERNDRQIRINQMTAEIEELQRTISTERAKKEKDILVSTFENKSESVAMYEEIIRNNEENHRRVIEEYEQDITIVRENLNKLSLERDELLAEKTKLLGKLGTLTKKASHIAKESVRIRSENENHNQEVRGLKDYNESLQRKYDEVILRLDETQEEKETLTNNVKVLSKIHQEFINNEKTKTTQLKFITEEVYMTMKNMERSSIRFQEKLLYFVTQKAQFISNIKKDISKAFQSIKDKERDVLEQLSRERTMSTAYKMNEERLSREIALLSQELGSFRNQKQKI